MAEEKLTTRLLVMTPDGVVLDQAVTAIRLQVVDGWQGILPHHAPYIVQLVNGALLYRLPDDEQPHYMVLFGGTLEVKEDMVLVLTAAAEPGRDLQELARKLVESQAQADALAFQAHIEFTKVRAALLRALSDLPAAPEAIR